MQNKIKTNNILTLTIEDSRSCRCFSLMMLQRCCWIAVYSWGFGAGFIHKSQIRFSKSGVKSGSRTYHISGCDRFTRWYYGGDWYGRGREWGSVGSQKSCTSWCIECIVEGGWLSSFRDKNFNRGFPDQKLNLLVSFWGSHRWDMLRSKKMTGRRPTSLGHSDHSNIH